MDNAELLSRYSVVTTNRFWKSSAKCLEDVLKMYSQEEHFCRHLLWLKCLPKDNVKTNAKHFFNVFKMSSWTICMNIQFAGIIPYLLQKKKIWLIHKQVEGRVKLTFFNFDLLLHFEKPIIIYPFILQRGYFNLVIR